MPESQENPGAIRRVRCLRPFTSVELQPRGEVSFCCSEWAKVPYIGNLENQSLMDVWNSDTAQYFRRKMLAGEYEDVCRADVCPVLMSEDWREVTLDNNPDTIFPLTSRHVDDITAGRTFMEASPTYILMSNIEACNLKCPICGPFREIYLSHEKENPMKRAVAKQKEILQSQDALVADRVAGEIITQVPDLKVLGLSGAGDPFFRPDTKKILFATNKPQELEIALFTNGLLLNKKMWKKIRHNRFRYINVSVDAASKGTYQSLRIPGKWKTLMDNLKFIGALRKDGRIPQFVINFTVMRSNLEEIPGFVRLGREVGCDNVYFQRVRGSIWKQENFFDGPHEDTALKDQVKRLKEQALALSTPQCKVAFGNL